MMTAPFPFRHPDQPSAELVRGRDPETARMHWRLDRLVTDPRDQSVSRVEVAARDNLRDILADALAFEKRGGFVARGGLGR